MKRYGSEMIGTIAALLCLYGFWELAEDLAESPAILRFDALVSALIQSGRSDALTPVMLALTNAAGTVAVVGVTVVVAVLLWRAGHAYQARLVTALVLIGAALSTVLKNVVGRSRPPVETAIVRLPSSFAFPSGHTMASLCLAFGLGYVVVRSGMRRWLKALLLVPIVVYPVLVGTSRVYLGVHWPSDVLASWLLAGAFVSLLFGIYEGRRRRGLTPAP